MKREESVNKYLNVLRELKMILDVTPVLSMYRFSTKHEVSKNLSTVLQNGGIVVLKNRGKYSKWEWISIAPNVKMAEKVIRELAKLNPPRTRKKKEVVPIILKTEKTKEISFYQVNIFFGLIKLKVKPQYK